MEDRIFMKEGNGGIWERDPRIGFILTFFISFPIYLIVTFSMGRLIDYLFPKAVADVIENTEVMFGLLLYIAVFVVFVMHCNQKYNMSKSTAFIQRDGKLYALQLLYTRKDLGRGAVRPLIYMPSGTIAEAAALPHNVAAASSVQAHEKEVKERRRKAESYAAGLDDVLEHLKANPGAYHVVPNAQRSAIARMVNYDVLNNGLAVINTEAARYKFLILEKPDITEQNDRYFIINFYNEANELCSAKFSNCYGNILDGLNLRF